MNFTILISIIIRCKVKKKCRKRGIHSLTYSTTNSRLNRQEVLRFYFNLSPNPCHPLILTHTVSTIWCLHTLICKRVGGGGVRVKGIPEWCKRPKNKTHIYHLTIYLKLKVWTLHNGQKFHDLIGHSGHSINAFSMPPTTVKVQKKLL